MFPIYYYYSPCSSRHTHYWVIKIRIVFHRTSSVRALPVHTYYMRSLGLLYSHVLSSVLRMFTGGAVVPLNHFYVHYSHCYILIWCYNQWKLVYH